MAYLGRINEFDEKNESFNAWYMRFKYFVEANGITETTKKAAILISSLGPKTFAVLLDLLVPDTPESKSYEQLVEKLTNYYEPKKILTAERFKFYSSVQQSNETISQFVTKLKHLATECKFGTFLPEALRDRFICGLREPSIQRKLIEDNMPFEETVQKAIMLEQIAAETTKFSVTVNASPAEVYSQTVKDKDKSSCTKHFKQHTKGYTKEATKAKTPVNSQCYRCGKDHEPRQCPYKAFKCRTCGKIGHLAKACRTRKVMYNVRENRKQKAEEGNVADQPSCSLQLWKIENAQVKNPAYEVLVEIEDQPVNMVLDSGAAVSIIPEALYQSNFHNIKLAKPTVSLEVYGGAQLPLLGEMIVTVKYESQQEQLRLFVAKDLTSKTPALLGREWLERLKLNWSHLKAQSMLNIKTGQKELIRKLKSEFPSVFSEETGTIKDCQARLVLKDEFQPVFCKARPIPLALKDKVKEELDKLEERGIIESVRHSDWATPIVVVPKANNNIRICGDYKVSLNPQLRTDHYPLPTVEDIFETVAGGKVFAVLDLSTAYLQLKVTEDSRDLLTINTPFGLYRFNRLCYGVSAAPTIFQSVMDKILHGLSGTMCYIDDILIAGLSEEDCFLKLRQVCSRLQQYNIKLNEHKCQLFMSSVDYLGHVIDDKGIRPRADKMCAIKAANPPQSLTELKAYLGLINYYSKFIPQLSTLLHPLYQLTQKNIPWMWSPECQRAFEKSKECLTDQSVLIPYHPDWPLKLYCDASGVGLGAILTHVLEKGDERPIFFASKLLSTAEQNYSNIEREALAIVYGIKRFHKYLYGRSFEIVTDHKPLLSILHPRKATSSTTSARLQRWSVLLSAYNYKLTYKQGSKIPHVDGLSRLLTATTNNENVECEINYFSPKRESPLTDRDVQKATQSDVQLKQVFTWIQQGWPTGIAESFRSYVVRKNELTIDDGCIIWGNRVVIPDSLRAEVLDLLHEQHSGISKTKMLARSYFWWPGIDLDIEATVKACDICQETQNANTHMHVYPWPYPDNKWERIHVDLATLQNQIILTLVDAYSKWAEVKLLRSSTSIEIINEMRSVFATHGLPHTVVTDNGTQFCSHEFEDFCAQNGMKHVCIPPRHPASNGQVERAIQTIKRKLHKQRLEDLESEQPRTWQHLVDNILLAYRTTPHSTTETSPAEILMSRKPRTRLDMLKPNLARRVSRKTEKWDANVRKYPNTFVVGEQVYIWDTYGIRNQPRRWIKGQVLQKLGAVLYKVVDQHGRHRVLHVDALRKMN